MPTSHQEEIIRYLKEKVVDGYMLEDLKRMVDLPVIPNQTGNCNFPITLYIFSCIEFLGTLVAETPIPDGHGATQARFWAYVEMTFGDNLQIFQQHRSTFIQIFRHGLTHEFFAKNAGISRQHTEVFSTSEGGKLVLDADRFYDTFKESCVTLKALFDTSDKLKERVADRYLDLQRRNQNRWGSTNSPTARASGASISRPFTPDQSLATPSLPPDEGAK